MPMKPKNPDKNDKMSEIDEKILKNFDIKKVGEFSHIFHTCADLF